MPVFAARTRGIPSSTARSRAWAKCWRGPGVSPNQAIFPGAVAPHRERPGLLLNVTNDGWFGDTPGPRP
jgi:apolipoprotein N-acyltransferase